MIFLVRIGLVSWLILNFFSNIHQTLDETHSPFFWPLHLDIFPPPLSPLLSNFCFFLSIFVPRVGAFMDSSQWRCRFGHQQRQVLMTVISLEPRLPYTRTQTNPFADTGSSCVLRVFCVHKNTNKSLCRRGKLLCPPRLLRVLRFAGPAARHDFPSRRYKGLAKIWTSSHVHDRAIPRLSPSTTTPTSQFREAHHSRGTQEKTIQDLIR